MTETLKALAEKLRASAEAAQLRYEKYPETPIHVVPDTMREWASQIDAALGAGCTVLADVTACLSELLGSVHDATHLRNHSGVEFAVCPFCQPVRDVIERARKVSGGDFMDMRTGKTYETKR